MPTEPTSEARNDALLLAKHNAVEAERASLAAQLHDHPLQELAGVGFQLERVLMALDRGATEDAVALVDDATNHLRRQIDGLRVLMSELRAPQLDRVDLSAAILALAARLRGQPTAPSIEVDLAPSVIDQHATTCLYRIVQDVLAAFLCSTPQPRHLAVSTAVAGRDVILTLTGDCTIEPEMLLGHSSTAPLSVIDRVRLLDGTATVQPLDAGGTCLRIVAPVADATPTAEAPAPTRGVPA